MGLDLPFQKKLSHPVTCETLHKSYFWGKKTSSCCFSGVLYQWESRTDISFQQVLGARLFGYEILLVFLDTTSHYHFLVAALPASQYRAWEAAGAVSWIMGKNWSPSKTAKRLQICCERSPSKPSSPRKILRCKTTSRSWRMYASKKIRNLTSSASQQNKPESGVVTLASWVFFFFFFLHLILFLPIRV